MICLYGSVRAICLRVADPFTERLGSNLCRQSHATVGLADTLSMLSMSSYYSMVLHHTRRSPNTAICLQQEGISQGEPEMY